MLQSPHLQHRVALQQAVSHSATPFRGWAGLCIELEKSLGGLCLACPTLSRNHHCLVPTLSTKCPVYSVSHCKPGGRGLSGSFQSGTPPIPDGTMLIKYRSYNLEDGEGGVQVGTLTGYTPPAEDHSKWGASQIEAGHLYEAGSPQVGHVKIVKGILHE